MVKRVTKYRRYVPAYRKDLRWRATTCNPAWIFAFLEARDRLLRYNYLSKVDITGFGGWKVNRVSRAELDRFFSDE